jgi:hypothetical protein
MAFLMQGAWSMPESLYITEMARDVRKAIRPLALDFTGWRAVFKRK